MASHSEPREFDAPSTECRAEIPRVSVVMPVYNGARHLAEALDSLLAQTYPDFEIVAVDDGSVDGSWEMLQQYAARDRRMVLSRHTTNQGHCAASNAAITLARGEFIARHDQDDIALPSRLAEAVAVLDARPEVGFVHSAYLRMLPEGRLLPRYPPSSHSALRRALMFNNVVCHAAVSLRRSVLASLDEWYRDLPGPQDYELWIRVVRQAASYCITEPLVVYRQEVMAMSEMYADRMDGAVAELSARQLNPYVAQVDLAPVRALHGLTAVKSGDRHAVGTLHRVFVETARREPGVDPAEATLARREWTRRALRAVLSSSARAPRDPRLLWAIVRHDPAGAARALMAEARGLSRRHSTP